MAEQQQPTLGLPAGISPDQLDIMTELTSLLSRLRTPVNLPGISSSTMGQTPAAPTPSQSQSQQQHSNNNQSSQHHQQPTGDISLRDFPPSTDHLRLKLQSAKSAVLALPDMDKSIADQEGEIRELEDRIRRQRDQLGALKDKGNRFAASERMVE
ncbi:RNA polymerase II transcription mediator complex subunit 9-domain-containing protein [Truncatella angustata]|uniref:Mediator of RNA polymerase II transcription subunit 9 n=1 Tax=Truncatella angustata TaxID=152316 RepID=A0A9P8ZWD4_9PEZI|nr:RNA polymerase II transcription mediator complex subunit 9-domain-containing protein [Truncatella angustata]KAH6651992.1 RNA polymerase II transcription mediator complex subunit 9-domain-containing protein [Truncatella angustata]KAH8205714.1 hypothetical protein TruAng_000208 [Truncatella angustata]